MEEKKRYAVFGLFNKMEVEGFSGKLPDEQWFIPVFESKEKAEEFAEGKFDVIELSTINNS